MRTSLAAWRMSPPPPTQARTITVNYNNLIQHNSSTPGPAIIQNISWYNFCRKAAFK